MSFLRYPEYKDSGVEWLGEVPGHWQLLPLKRDIAFLTSGSRGWAEHYSDEGALFLRIGNLTRDGIGLDLSDIQRVEVPEGAEGARTQVQEGDLLFSITAYLGSVAVVPPGLETAYVSQHVALVRLRKALFLPEWIAYVVSSWIGKTYLETQGYGGTKVQLSLEDVANTLITVPPISEQLLIASFIRNETTKIDALMAEQENLIQLLEEKRQAMIAHVVTKGLNPAVPMKDSAVEWLGEVPSHWDYGALNRISDRVVVGIAEAATHAYSESGVPILRATNIRAGQIIGELLFIDPEFSGERGSKLIHKGDLVTVRTGNAGVTALIPPELDGCQCFTMLITTLNSSSCAEFYCYWMNSLAAQRYFSLEGWGTAQINISVPILKGLSVPIPPLSEQLEIVDFLKHETSNLDQLIDQAESAVGLLKERRSALISAAVTGQIDVRGLAKDEQEQVV
ncbi:restriction endonuclease subunit S [Pseudomonas chlororaphis]|uniref:restriction endonuclease subunit S n=1 Tax=Pseudomonas chlororaphis TaxID=587753 RepID=UPI00236896D4|nr:restriction endonuclease subunit S [Pseudomonas chlororaphis]WDH37729.1 restriction endonuclease subunit S [Pseudomonas chlororaphis]WDH43816.1 restriction endonuclease subunit S [Pseudomonas chlororaphis]